jgi:hypothetical protein
MNKIPGLGISVNEAIGALESKDFITVFGMVNAAMRKVEEQTLAPSESLDQGIVEDTLSRYLTTIASSTATDPDSVELKQFAEKALLDRSILGRILDYSTATDLVSTDIGERNIPNPLVNGNVQADIVANQTRNDRSFATDLDGNNSGLNPENLRYNPGNSATDNPIENADTQRIAVSNQSNVDRSFATDLDGDNSGLDPRQIYTEAPGVTGPGEEIAPLIEPTKAAIPPQPIIYGELETAKLDLQGVLKTATNANINPGNPISAVISKQTNSDRSFATDLDGDNSGLDPQAIIYNQTGSATTNKVVVQPIVYEGLPSSSATNNDIETG